MAADVTRQNARIGVVSTRGRKADDDGEDLALVEISGARRQDRGEHADEDERKQRAVSKHCDLVASSCGVDVVGEYCVFSQQATATNQFVAGVRDRMRFL